jgi:cytoskeletal protein RodZ
MPGIGPTLRDARIRARIDVAEVEARTKIRAKYLRAIENEEWDLLPGPVYIRSFLRTYGDYLGLDSRMLVEEFRRRYEQPADELHPIAPLRRERQPDRGPRRGVTFPPWLAVVGVLVAVVVVLYIVGTNSSNKHSNTQPTSARAGVHQGKHHHSASAHKATTPAPHKPRKVTLQLIPTAPVYVCLENGARKAVIPGVIYDVGQTIPTETAKEFFLTLGNANVQMKVNGKPVTVPQSTTAIALRIVPQGPSPLPPGRQPTCT